jgi:O-antigen/teichoic acid export membrane protein
MQSSLSWLKRPHVANVACVVLLLLLPLTLFVPVTLGGYTLLPADNLFAWQPFKSAAAAFGIAVPQNELLSDLILENYPWKRFILASLAGGELPLWNPYLFAGVPFLAAGQHSAMYPFSLLYYILPLEKAYGWFTVLQLGLAGVFTFILMRTFGLRRYGAVFASVAYQLSGFFVVSVVFPMIIAGGAWLPLILAMCERVIRQSPALGNRPSSMPWVVVGALAIAMVVLAGHVEILAYTLIVTAFFCAWRVSTVIGFRNLRLDGPYLVGRLAWLVVMGLAGLCIGAVQLVPLLELVTRNFRQGSASLEEVMGYAFPLRYIVQWLGPDFFGNPAHHTYFDLFSFSAQPVATASRNTAWGIKNYVEGAAYVGIVTLVFAGVAIADAARPLFDRWAQRARHRGQVPVWFFVVLGVLALLFIFGTPAYAILFFGVPGFSQLHSPFRWIFPLTLCLAALAGAGLDALATESKGRLPVVGAYRPKAALPSQRSTSRAQWIASCAVMGLGALIVAVVLILRLTWPAVRPFFDRVVSNAAVQQGFTSAEMFFSYQALNAVRLGLLALAAGAVWWLLLKRRADGAHEQSVRARLLNAAPALAIALLAIDMNWAWAGFNPAVDPKLLGFTPPAMQALQADTSLWRLTAYEPRAGKPLNANSAWLFDFQDIRGYDSIIPKQYTDFMWAIEPQGELLYNRIAPIKNSRSLESPLLDLLGVKYVVTEDEIAAPGFSLFYDDGATRIYKNERALPRAFTLPISSTIVADDFAQAIQRYDPRKFVLVDGDAVPAGLASAFTDGAAGNPRAEPGHPTPASVTSYRNNEVWVDVQIGGPSWLILADSYFPGWRAFVRPLGAPDGEEREVPIVKVNGNFRGVMLGSEGAGVDNARPSSSDSSRAFTVRFRYSPDSFRIGAFATFIALVAMLFLGGVYVWRNAVREMRVQSGVRLVARNSLILTGLNIVARMIDFAFALLMLRVLGPEGAGNFYFAVVIVGWFEIVMNFGLNTFLTREIARDRAQAPAYLLQTSRLRMMLALGVAPVVLLVVLIWRATFGLAGEAGIAILLLTFSQIPSSLATGLSALFFAYERAEVPASLTIVSALLKATIGAALLLLGWGVVGLGVTSIVVNLVTLVILLIATRQLLRAQPAANGAEPSRPATHREMLRESFPLMLNHLLATMFFKVDVPMLQAIRGPLAVGWYSAAYKFIDAFNIIPAFFTQSLFPAMSRMALQRDASLARSYTLALKLLVMTSLPLAVVSAFLAEPMIGILGGREFLPNGAIALAIMAWSMPIGWINSVTNYALIAAGQQRALTRAFIIGLAFNVITNALFIPLFSFVAAAVTTILSEIVEGAAFYVFVRQYIAPVNWVEVLAKPFLAAGVMAALTALFAAGGVVVAGLILGLVAYGATLWLTHALAPQEREILRPLVKRST